MLKDFRKYSDTFAVCVHAVLLAFALSVLDSEAPPHTTARVWLIVGVETVSLGFHLYVVSIWSSCWAASGVDYIGGTTPLSVWNKWKWAEYGVTATAGTVAVSLQQYSSVSNDVIFRNVAIIVAGGVVQQTIGLKLDNPTTKPNPTTWVLFLFAVLLQIVEFTLIASPSKLGCDVGWDNVGFVVYAFMWSSFGIICGARLLQLSKTGSASVQEKTKNVHATEFYYSAYGWIAKLSVGATTLLEIDQTSDTPVKYFACFVAIPLLFLPVLVANSTTKK